MDAPVVTRHRCTLTHPGIRSFLLCAWPAAREISGQGKWCCLNCAVTTITQHTSEAEADAQALQKCAHNCRDEHRVVRADPDRSHPGSVAQTTLRFSHP